MRPGLSIAAVSTAVLALAVPGAGAVAAELPPRGAMSYQDLTGTCQMIRGNNYFTVSANPTVNWFRHPKKKGPTTVGHYLRVKAEIQAAAGYGGTLWKPLAKASKKSQTVYLGRPTGSLTVPVSVNLAQGLGSYRIKITARVVRDVKLAADTTAWKFTAYSEVGPCWGYGAT